MKLSEVVERLERTVNVCGSPDSTPSDVRAALKATTEVQWFVAARRAELIKMLDEQPNAFPEAAIADTSGCSLGQASKEKDRSATLDAAHAMADALSDGDITTGHVDVLTREARNVDAATKDALLNDASLADAAKTQSIAEFRAHVRREARKRDRTDPEERLRRQKGRCRVTTWAQDEMFHLKAVLDPETGDAVAKALKLKVAAKRAEELPDYAPADPIERSSFVDAVAFIDIICLKNHSGKSNGVGKMGPPLVVVDASQCNGAGGPVIDWGIPVELPERVLREVLGQHDPDVVIVANGVVLYAPGNLNLGRSTRLANRDQRRALAGMYSTCAVPGCTVHYDRCRLHHVIWWSKGGLTDLDNLLPVCQHHHTKIHEHGWNINLGPNRELTIEVPDGQTIRAGPPRRGAA